MTNERFPGTDSRWIICDVCGLRYRAKDTIRVNDRYNQHNQLIVCRWDADKINPQVYPITLKETVLEDPSYIRKEQTDLFTTNPASDQLPGPPTNLRASLDPLYSYINLYWDGPDHTGSSPIIGYLIEYANPQLSSWFTLATTTTPIGYFQDTTSNISDVFTYRVSAISNLGTGTPSAPYYWPTKQTEENINYLITSDTLFVITTGSGDLIVL